MRIIIAGIVAGIIVFVWGAVMHIALPIGSMGLNYETTPAEPAVLEALKGLPESGIYLMPGQDTSITDLDEQKKTQAAAWEAGPSALIVLQADGGPTMGAQTLGLQFLANVLAGLMAAMVIASAKCGYFSRVAIMGLLGLFTWFNTDASYWIWYGFPDEFTLVTGIGHIVGWLAAGIVVAAIVKPSALGKAPAEADPPMNVESVE
ncbi:MAG: hypothetical protein O7G85_01230 [Planctomycetota bacterium]|nr:hypothetical protein [Planctomycetota bacterium]